MTVQKEAVYDDALTLKTRPPRIVEKNTMLMRRGEAGVKQKSDKRSGETVENAYKPVKTIKKILDPL
jgi:hypothetical protein